MKWASVIGITIIVALIVLYQWPRIDPDQKREKRTFIILMVISFLLAIFLVFFPETASPMQMFKKIFESLPKM